MPHKHLVAILSHVSMAPFTRSLILWRRLSSDFQEHQDAVPSWVAHAKWSLASALRFRIKWHLGLGRGEAAASPARNFRNSSNSVIFEVLALHRRLPSPARKFVGICPPPHLWILGHNSAKCRSRGFRSGFR
jgi:hypothetical protein